MKRTLSILLVLLFAGFNLAFAQDTTELKKPKVEFSGFLRLDYWADTRLNNEALDGLFIFYPLPEKLDANGKDINAVGGLNFLAMATRLRTNITMPKVFNAKPSVLIEADFTGLSNNVHMRFRHALAKFSWESGSELNLGLTWHPMFVSEVFPHVASLNTGAPFQSFYRSPQITFKQSITPSFKIILSAITQSDNRNVGPDAPTGSSKLLRHSMIPNLHAQLQYANGPITLGLAADYKNLRPLLSVKSLTQTPAPEYVTNERIIGLSYMGYFKYQSGLLTAKLKGMYGQNLGEHLLLGGYAVTSIDSLTGIQKYTPVNHIFGHVNITYGKTFMPGIFMGYAKNLGASKNVLDDKRVYGRGMDIEYLYRVAPNVTFRNKNLSIMSEVEYTVAATGQIEVSNRAKVVNAKETANTRFLVMIQYDF